MNVNHHQAKRDRSYFEWGDKMQIVRKGNGDIAMTETELVDFFGVTWRKLNYRLQLLLKTSHLHPDERDAGEEEIFVNGRAKGYARECKKKEVIQKPDNLFYEFSFVVPS